VLLFRPDILLLNPHLYHLFDELVGELLLDLEAFMKDYISKSCSDLKNGRLTHELIWVKNAVSSTSREIVRVYEEFGPSGVELAKLLINLSARNETFAVFELLQLFGRQRMPD
jgi:hypothetical protein